MLKHLSTPGLILVSVGLLSKGCSLGRDDLSTAIRVDSLLLELQQKEFFNGAVVVSRDLEIVYEKGFGLANVEHRLPFTPHTPTECASMLKTFVAASIMMLHDAGQLDLDKPVQTYIPSLPYSTLTVRDLLAHRSGLPDYNYFEEFVPDGEPWSPEGLLKILEIRKPPLRFIPGTQFEYNNFCFDLLELTIERATGSRFDTFVRQHIVLPLGLSSALFPPPRYSDYPGIRTMSYDRIDGVLKVRPDEDDGDGIYTLHISAHDLHLWRASFFDTTLLSKRAMEAGLSRPILADGQVSNLTLLSWYSSDDNNDYWYSGHYNGFYCLQYRDFKKKYSISFMSNTNIPMWLRPQLITSLVDILDGHPGGILSPPAATTLDSLSLPTIQSAYALGNGWRVDVQVRDQRAYFRKNAGLEYQMFQVDEKTLYVPGLDAWIWFSQTDKSPVGQIHCTTVLGEQVGTRAVPSGRSSLLRQRQYTPRRGRTISPVPVRITGGNGVVKSGRLNTRRSGPEVDWPERTCAFDLRTNKPSSFFCSERLARTGAETVVVTVAERVRLHQQQKSRHSL